MEVDKKDDVPFQMGDFQVNQPLIFQVSRTLSTVLGQKTTLEPDQKNLSSHVFFTGIKHVTKTLKLYTPPKPNMEQKNWWCVNMFPFPYGAFSGAKC